MADTVTVNNNGPTGNLEKVADTLAKSQQTWQFWVQALLVGLGAYKQYKMYDQMGDMYESQQAYIDKQRELIDSQYNELTKPQYVKSSDYLWQYAQPFSKSILETVIKCGIKVCEYVKDTSTYNRAVLKIGPAIARARKRSFSQVGVGQIGLIAENEYRYTELEARLMTKAIAIADRYEDQRKLQWDQFYWTKMTTSAQIAQNVMSVGANLLNGGANGIQNVISAMGNSAQIGAAITARQAQALEGQIGVIGGIGSGIGTVFGQMRGQEFAQQLLRVSGMIPGNSATASSFGIGVNYGLTPTSLTPQMGGSDSMYGLSPTPL